MAYLPPLNGGRVNVQISGNSTSAGAGYATISSGTMTLAGGNNVTLSQNGNALTISGANLAAAQTGISGMSAAGGMATSGTVSFSNGSGVSFGMNGQTMTASVQTNYLTTAMQSNAATISNINLSAGTTSNNLSKFVLSNSNGLAFGLNGSTITGSYTQAAQSNPNISLFATGNTTQNSSTVLNASNLSFNAAGSITAGFSNGSIQLSAPNALTTARASTDAIGLNTAGTNVTWTANSSGLSLNGGGYAGTGLSGTNVTATHNTNGLQLDAAGYAGTGFSGTNATATLDSNGLQLSVGAGGGGGGGVALYDGTNSITSGTAYLSDANGVSLGINGQTVTASVSVSNPALSFYQNRMPQNSAQPYTTLAVTHHTMLIQPLSPVEGYGFPGDMTISTFMMDMSASVSATSASSSYASAVSVGIYLLNNSSQLTLVNSASTSWSAAANTANSTGWYGLRFLTIHSSNWSSTPVLSFDQRYWYGVLHGSTNFSAAGAAWIGQYIGASNQRSGTFGVSNSSNTSMGMVPFLGIYSASLSSMPVSLGNSQIDKVNVSAGFAPAVILNATFSAF